MPFRRLSPLPAPCYARVQRGTHQQVVRQSGVGLSQRRQHLLRAVSAVPGRELDSAHRHLQQVDGDNYQQIWKVGARKHAGSVTRTSIDDDGGEQVRTVPKCHA